MRSDRPIVEGERVAWAGGGGSVNEVKRDPPSGGSSSRPVERMENRQRGERSTPLEESVGASKPQTPYARVLRIPS